MAILTEEEIREEMYKVFPELKSFRETKRITEEQKILSQVTECLKPHADVAAELQRNLCVAELGLIKAKKEYAKTPDLRKIGPIALLVCIGIAILIVIIVLITGDTGGSKELKNTCGVCGRTFSYTYDKENYKSVRNRNMCLNCYNNYKQGTQAVDDIRNNGV